MAAGGQPATPKVPVALSYRRSVDLLFVVDNSGSMADKQATLTATFPKLLDRMATIEGGVPDLHLGVVSTNVGTGGVNIGGCSSATRPQGDDGNLLTNQCPGLTGQFVSDVKQADGSRMTNYTGDLATLFTCMAKLGTTGCGFEQPLEAMSRALQPGKNPGFVRPDAHLAVVFLGDEDDCSAKDGGALFGDPNGTVNSPLGPRTSFRCHEFGVTCDSRESPTRHVVVAGITGPVDDQRSVDVIPDPDDATRPAVGPSCTAAVGSAAPSVRTQHFVDAFADHNLATTICNADLTDAMQEIGNLIEIAVGNPCIDRALADRDPNLPGVQPECSVSDVLNPDEEPPTRTETTIPACDGNGNTPPCWRITSDQVQCPMAPDHLAVDVNRGGASVPLGTVLEVQCVTE